MEKINRETPDLTQENIAKIAALFPDAVTEATDDEGNVRLTVDFDALRDDLSGEVMDGPRERYQFTWPGKREAKLEARRPTKKTMRPCPEKSKDWDTTQNLYIEGDNLETLKIMRETYAGKVKLIYIDPPIQHGSRLRLRRRLLQDARGIRRRERRLRRGGRPPGCQPRVQRALPLRLVLDDVPQADAGQGFVER